MLKDFQGVLVSRALLVLEEWHLRQVAAKVFLSVGDFVMIYIEVSEQIPDWLGLSSNIKVAKEWFLKLSWTILGRSSTCFCRLQFFLQIFDGLLMTNNNTLLLIDVLLEL